MALGTNPLFLASAIWPNMEEARTKAGKPVTSLIPWGVSVPFTMQAQTQSNWCWAAAAASTSTYYLSTSTWTQCGVANADLPRSDCCGNPVPSACNVPWYLDTALGVTGNFASMTGPISKEAVILELQAYRPIGARIAWAGGGAHFVAIIGYFFLMQNHYYTIADPYTGTSTSMRTISFEQDYGSIGSQWTNSYYTQAAT